MSKVPQLVWTTAVASSPFFRTCLGALKLTFFAGGASTFLQLTLPEAVVVAELSLEAELPLEPVLLSLLPPLREIRIPPITPAATTAQTIRMIQRLSFCSPIRSERLEQY